MLRRLVHKMADRPALWDAARHVIEAGYRGEKAVIRGELGSLQGVVLDVACGTGIYSPLFPDSSYTGVDLSEGYVARARRKYKGKKFLAMDALDLRFAEASFDAVLMVGFLHHLTDVEVRQALREVKRVLKPGGTFLLIEDCPTRSRWNLLGRFLQSLDAGNRIRANTWYEQVIEEELTPLRAYPLSSGLWDYFAYVLRRPD